MVAALGWGSATAMIGGIVAAISLGAIFGIPYMLAFALTIALPAWWLGYLTLLARPVSDDPQLANLAPALDWYPTGRVLLWIAGFATLTTISALLTLGTDAETINTSLRRGCCGSSAGAAPCRRARASALSMRWWPLRRALRPLSR
jgi:ABC-type dipeptide/oligopeptide/nickel transport system permease component